MFNQPLGFFISFRTYGTWLHGDERGSVDRRHNQFGTPLVSPSNARQGFESQSLRHEPVDLTPDGRRVVLDSIRDVALHKAWTLHAADARTNHVHVVITAPPLPERVMNTLKTWATRRLREAGLARQDQRIWSRHGSTIYLFRPENMAEKIRYVNECQ